jgi:MFS family permease
VRPTGLPTLSRRAAFWVSAAVVAHTLWTSAAPAVTYPLYAAQWHLTPTVTTAIFAVYPVAVVTMLLLFGNLSDHIGRRAAMLLGLGASLLGVLSFALAASVEWLFVGRVLMGVGVGLSASPATAALVEFSAAGQSQRANSIATAATAVGLALAVLVGGALIEYAPYPLHLNFWFLFVVLAALWAAAWFLPRHTRGDNATRWSPSAIAIPREIRTQFIASSLAVTAGYAIGAINLSLGAQIARDLIGSGNALVNGGALALFATVTGVVAIFAKRMPAHTSIAAGGIASASAMALLMLAAADEALPVFLLAMAVAGGAYSLLFLGGLTLINAHAPAHQRGATLSAVYLVGYLMMGVIAFALGVAATSFGLKLALEFGAPVIALLGLGAAVLSFTGRPDHGRAAPVREMTAVVGPARGAGRVLRSRGV